MITDFGAELASPAVPPDNPSPGRSPTASACEPYRETIELGLSPGRNAMAIWQDLVDTCGFAGGYALWRALRPPHVAVPGGREAVGRSQRRAKISSKPLAHHPCRAPLHFSCRETAALFALVIH